MDFTRTIDAESRLAVIAMSGKYNTEEFLHFYEALTMADNADRLDSIIWDARNLDVGHVTILKLQSVIDAIGEGASRRAGGKAAWVVSDQLGYGMGRMFESLSSGRVPISIRVFYDLSEAHDWILNPSKVVPEG